jgi:hypothetical protein
VKFRRVETDENFDFLKFVSEEGQWELGVFSVIYGRRVRLGRAGATWVNLDYCAGDNFLFCLELLDAVGTILSQFPENISGGDIERHFPGYDRRPIDRDPCWEKLSAMRDAIAPTGSFLRPTLAGGDFQIDLQRSAHELQK